MLLPIVVLALATLGSGYPSYPYYQPEVYPDVYPVHPGGIGGIFKGPDSETIIKGPDGSVITAEAIGGAVEIKPDVPAPVLVHQPLLPVPVPALAPAVVVAHHQEPTFIAPAPVLAQAGPVLFENNPVIVAEHPVVIAPSPKVVAEQVLVGGKVITVPKAVQEDTDLVGPSGTISIRGDDAVISGPASLTVKGDGVVADIAKEPITTVIKTIPPPKTVVVAAQPIVQPQPIIVSKPQEVVARPALVASTNYVDVSPPLVSSVPRFSHRPIVGPDTVLSPYGYGKEIVSHGAVLSPYGSPYGGLVKSNVVSSYGPAPGGYLAAGGIVGPAYYNKPVYHHGVL